MIDVIAKIVAIVSLLVALGNAGYLAMLNNAAGKRSGGAPVSQYVRSRLPIAGGTTAVSLLALIFTSGNAFMDILAILLAVGSGLTAMNALRATQAKYRSGS